MCRYTAIVALLASVALIGCHPKTDAGADSSAPPDPAGRAGHTGYVGIGIYTPNISWQRLVEAKVSAKTNETSARKVDDQAIIVVQNSLTGDIRVCGDMTGYCVGMNPWARAPGQLTPVSMTSHQPTEAETAAQQQQEADAATKNHAALIGEIRKAAARRHHQRS